jgi:hypothetical protein
VVEPSICARHGRARSCRGLALCASRGECRLGRGWPLRACTTGPLPGAESGKLLMFEPRCGQHGPHVAARTFSPHGPPGSARPLYGHCRGSRACLERCSVGTTHEPVIHTRAGTRNRNTGHSGRLRTGGPEECLRIPQSG